MARSPLTLHFVPRAPRHRQVKRLGKFDKLVSLSLHGNDIEQVDGEMRRLACRPLRLLVSRRRGLQYIFFHCALLTPAPCSPLRLAYTCALLHHIS